MVPLLFFPFVNPGSGHEYGVSLLPWNEFDFVILGWTYKYREIFISPDTYSKSAHGGFVLRKLFE